MCGVGERRQVCRQLEFETFDAHLVGEGHWRIGGRGLLHGIGSIFLLLRCGRRATRRSRAEKRRSAMPMTKKGTWGRPGKCHEHHGESGNPQRVVLRIDLGQDVGSKVGVVALRRE